MTQTSDRRMADLLKKLQQDPSLPERLPHQEAEIVNEALAGQTVYEIAQKLQLAEGAIWEVLGSAARAAAGETVQRVETAGLGSDTDPGVTGGYDETGFGRLPADPPATPEDVNRDAK